MKILIDSHVHIYPHYDIETLLSSFEQRIVIHNADIGVIMLTERYGVDVFKDILSLNKAENLVSDESSILLCKSGKPDIIIVSGRQIACAERIEVLALATRNVFNDGRNICDSINEVINAKGIPVLAWGVGKWMFKRKSIVESVLKTFTPNQLLVGDTSLRPIFWRLPRLMSAAMKKRFRVVVGSDPLPSKDDERIVGQYANLVSDATIDTSKALTPQIVEILRSSQMTIVGRRAGVFEFVKRITVRTNDN